MIARYRAIAMAVMVVIVLGACGAPPTTAPTGSPGMTAVATAPAAATAPATATPPPTVTAVPTGTPASQLPPELTARVDVGGHRLYIHCSGAGSPA